MEDPLLPPSTIQINSGADPQQEPRQPQRSYPDPFYCLLTQEVMKDPVVGADGDSLEKSAVLERDAADDSSVDTSQQKQRTYYPNRALKIIIVKEKQHVAEQSTVRGALHSAKESLRASLEQVMERAILPTPNDYHRPLPDAYYCPITLDIISRPVIDPDGNTYERRAILGWIRAHGTSPLTRNALTAEQLRGNNALEKLIDDEVNRADDSIHPSIRRWKESRKEEDDDDDDEENALPDPPSREEAAVPEEDDGGDGPRPMSREEIAKFVRAPLIFALSLIFMIVATQCVAAFFSQGSVFYILFSVFCIVMVFLNLSLDIVIE